jgi:hypothetical protein
LEATEARFGRILILMRPWFVGRKVLATNRVRKGCSERVLGEAEIDSIERDDEILGVINLFKCADDSRLARQSA